MSALLRSVRELPARLRAFRGGARSARHAAAPPFRRKLLFEALEPRILLSADLLPAAGESVLGTALVQSVEPQQPFSMTDVLAQQPAPRAIVFLDASLEQYQSQLGDAQVVLLDRERDGVEQITQALAGQGDIAAIHIITHGGTAGADLGAGQLGGSTIESYAQQIATWRDALTEDADILLYGCSTGADAAFLARLAELTGADVAASTDDTGAAALGGNWALESSTGPIEASTFAIHDYDALLATTDYQDGWGKTRVTGTVATNHNRLNFAGVDADLNFTIRGGGNVVVATLDKANTVTASGVDQVVSGQGANRFFIENNKAFPGAGLTLTNDDNTLTYTDPAPGFFSDSSWTTSVVVDLSDPTVSVTGLGRLTAQQLERFHGVTGGYGND